MLEWYGQGWHEYLKELKWYGCGTDEGWRGRMSAGVAGMDECWSGMDEGGTDEGWSGMDEGWRADDLKSCSGMDKGGLGKVMKKPAA